MSDTTGNPQSKSQSYSGNSPRPLSFRESYPCPVCRYGEIAALPLMDAFSCHFCRHIFSADLSQQLLEIADSEKPLNGIGTVAAGKAPIGPESNWAGKFG